MKYGLLKYEENEQFFNVGDNIQSLAAKQYLPQVDELINREEMASYDGSLIKLILNGWFTHNHSNWIPSDKIKPLFISFHINNTAAPFMLSKEGIAYLKKHEPIGCRDQFTTDILKEKGIDAYFSGCLTLTLDNYKAPESERTENIYIVDPLYGYTNKRKIFRNIKTFGKSILNKKILEIGKRNKHLLEIIDKEVLDTAIYINQEPPAKRYSHTEKFELAEELLHKYARAKFVITSRVHCALPCLAMGTPVIFINGFETFVDTCRFNGIVDLLNVINVDSRTGEFTNNFGLKGKVGVDSVYENPSLHLEIANNLKKSCNEFIKSK